MHKIGSVLIKNLPISFLRHWAHVLLVPMMTCCRLVWLGVLSVVLAACQGSSVTTPAAQVQRLTVPAPEAWGGEARCGVAGCRVALVEHETGFAVAHQFEERSLREVGRHKVAYHPDSAAWLADDLFAAAVEGSAGLDIFRLSGLGLTRVQQINVGFAPRDLLVLSADQGRYRVLVTPYSGHQAAWVEWVEGGGQPAQVQPLDLCRSPWHPTHVARAPGAPVAGVAVGCLDDRRVIWVSLAEQSAQPRVLASFNAVPRQVSPSPSGQWLYVSLETGGRNARIHMDTGELQYVKSPLTGSVAVAPVSDDLVMWGDSERIYLQRLDAQANVIATRWLTTSGFSTKLQLIDLDGDGERDVIVLNSAGPTLDVIYGPLWDQASERQP